MDDLIIEHLGGLCPVQGEGTYQGQRWYFRARHAAWEWAISPPAPPTIDPVDVMLGWESAGWRTGGPWGDPGGHEAGYMPDADAERLIRESCAAYQVLCQPEENRC